MGNENLKGPLDQIFICSEENVGSRFGFLMNVNQS